MSDDLMMVKASGLLAAVGRIPDALDTPLVLKNGVRATGRQLKAAAEALADGPQPQINGHAAEEMPGFISAELQEDPEVLYVQVGVLTSRELRIARDGTIR